MTALTGNAFGAEKPSLAWQHVRRVLGGAAVFFIGYLAFRMPIAVFLSGTSLQERGIWVAPSVSYLLMAALATVLILSAAHRRAIARRAPTWEPLDAAATAAGIGPGVLDGPTTDEADGARNPGEVSRQLEGA